MIRLAYPDLEFNEVKNQLKEVIDSGWLTKGPKTKAFEESLCRYLNVKYAIAVSSGTAALHLSLLSLGIGPGDEVIVPDFTFPATANVVELCGARAILADIELDNFNINPLEIEKKITNHTRAIIPVHQFGTPAQMDEILRMARKHNLYVIEDAACALGARYKKKMCGTIGNLGCFSFHPRKVITTGEGGAVVTNSLRLAKTLRQLREHGMRQNGTKKDFITLGFNYRISEVASILGLAQLEKIETIIQRRIKLNSMFRQIISRLKSVSVIPASVEISNRSVYQSFIVKMNKNINISSLISFLKCMGIEATISNIAIHTQPYYQRRYNFKKSELKNSSLASRKSITLPFHSQMTEKDFAKVVSALEEYLNEGRR